MAYQATIYAVCDGRIWNVQGTKSQEVYDQYLTFTTMLDEIDTEHKQSAEDWDEDPTNILPAREALHHILFDEEKDPTQDGVYASVVIFICTLMTRDIFTDWYGPHPLNIFEWVEKEAAIHKKKLNMLDLIFGDSPLEIPGNGDVHIGYWSSKTCRKNQKIVRKMIKNRSKSPNADDEGYERLAELLNWLDTTQKEKSGALVGIYY